jgi:aminoglycoside 3-N-acetyltransferase
MGDLEEHVAALGISRGTTLFVHSSVKAVGPGVRAETLIAALRTAIGDEGTLLFPTFTSREEDYFDPATTLSVMGAVAEVFRKMPNTIRSRHPRHPVAAQGPAARDLVDGHEYAVGPCGVGTPFEKLARMAGQVLMIGVDLDRLTLLHTAEALLDLPYLNDLESKYVDASGHLRKVCMRQVPGGHRGGVFGLEKTLRQRDLIHYGRVGNARSMLMDAGPVLEAMIAILRANPAAALCQGDYCPDCVDSKAKIRTRQLIELGASVSVVLPKVPERPNFFNEMVRRFLFGTNVTLASRLDIIRLSPGEQPPAPPSDDREWILQPAPLDLIKLRNPPAGYAGLAFAPLDAARAGIRPFDDVLYRGKCRDFVTDILVEDGLTSLPGTRSPALGYLLDLVPDRHVVLGDGHAQLQEIISALRMRGFSGRYHLIIPEGNLYAETYRLLKEFWRLVA